MKKVILSLVSLALIATACDGTSKKGEPLSAQNLTALVDPYIGTDYHGHVFLGASVPFGGVQLGPSNITQGWDWCSGYHYSDSTIIGFAHTHLSGTGIGDLGDIVFMPVTGETPKTKGSLEVQTDGYLSKFDRKNEKVKPGYYSVLLNKYNIEAELTATERGGIHRYTYPANSKNATIIVDLESGIGWDAPTEGYLKQTSATTIEGYRYSKGWAPNQSIYFVAEFSEPIKEIALYDDATELGAKESGKATRLKAFIGFGDVAEGAPKVIVSKVAISSVNIEGAAANFNQELKATNFDNVAQQADTKWNNYLSKISISDEPSPNKRAFYTAMFHTAFAPALFNDVNGNYRGADGKIYNDSSNMYTIYSMWDTYRAANPLYTVLEPKRAGEFVNNFIKIYEQQGKVPVWHLVGNETDCMVGFSSIQVIADAYLKGIGGFDPEKAYEAVKAYALLNERGLDQIREKGYISAESEVESVAKALEYAISDWAIAQMALRMGKTDDYNNFMARSKNYTHYFDKQSGFMRGKMANGSWRTPFNPSHSSHRDDDYCEGNAWQYTWLVPHDVEGLIELFGSEIAFSTKLDSLFIIEADMGETASNDISGLVGQYAQGNEPNHSTPFLYNYVGEQWKTAALTRNIMDTYFTDKPDGLCGNEDAGQMSAWYIFSSLGFYPSNATSGAFLLSSPLFKEAQINLDNGKSFRIEAPDNSPKNIYIQSAQLNGKPYTKSYITYKDIMGGGTLKLTMGAEPNKLFGADKQDRPQSIVY